MSAEDELYRVLYFKDGRDTLTDPEPLAAARATAHRLAAEGYEVGSVMGDIAARGYMHARYGPESAAKPAAAENPFAPDLSMSPEVADFILRAVNGLLLEGYWPKGYSVDGRHGGWDTEDYDGDLVRRAADIVGRDKIQNSELRRFLAELDADAEETT